MKKSKYARILAVLFFVLILSSLSSAVAADGEANDETEWIVSTTAGMHGLYSYDLETGIETFIPPPSTIDHNNKVTPATGGLLEEEPSPRHIIGPDNRVKVTSPNKVQSTICLIGSRFNTGPNGVGVGTAWLINKNHLLTAAHNLYNVNYENSYGDNDGDKDDYYAGHVAVYVGASGGKFSQYRLAKQIFAAKDYREYTGTITNYLAKYDDWGIITLDSPVNINEFMGIYAVNSSSDMQGRYYYTAGYPEDLNKSSHSRWDDWDMYYTGGYITGDKHRFLDLVTTNIDFWSGQSGSPVYTFRDSATGWCAEAIVVQDTGDDLYLEKENYLILINDWLKAEIDATYSW